MPSVGDRLTAAARDILLAHPGLDPSRAYQLALERDPALAREHHLGGADPAPQRGEPATADPGELLMQHAARHRVSFTEACRARPELFQAWNRAEPVVMAPAPALVGLEPYRTTPRRHYSALSQSERRAELRKMGAGEALLPGRTYVAKLTGAEAGGGMFEVVP